MEKQGKSAPPPCGCGHVFAEDSSVHRHVNSIRQHETTSKEHTEWVNRGRPIPLPICGCGEYIPPAPINQHAGILERHKLGRQHSGWVASGAKPTGPKKQSLLTFGKAAPAAATNLGFAQPLPPLAVQVTGPEIPDLLPLPPELAMQADSLIVGSDPPAPQVPFVLRQDDVATALTAGTTSALSSLPAGAPLLLQPAQRVLDESPSQHNTVLCQGVNLVAKLAWPSPFPDHFSSMQHGTSMFLHVVIGSDGVLRVPGCTGAPPGGVCACNAFYSRSERQLRELRDTSQRDLISSSVKYMWRTPHQLRQALVAKDEVKDALKLQVTALRRAAVTTSQKNQHWFEVIRLLAEKRIPQLCELLQRCLDRGMRPGTVAERLFLAAEQVHQSGCWVGAEEDLARLLYSVAGERALKPVQKLFGTIGSRRVRQLHGAQRFTITLSLVAAPADAFANMRLGARNLGNVCTPRSLAFDGAALRQAVELDAARGMLRGLCIEHCREPVCRNDADALKLHSKLLDDVVHLARDANILGLSSVGAVQSNFLPLLAAGVCGKGVEDFTLSELLRALLDTWRSMPATDSSATTFAAVFGGIVAIGSDAASPFRRLYDTIVREAVVSSLLKVGGMSAAPSLSIDLPGAEFGPLIGGVATWFFDWKHCIKRLRLALLSNMKVNGFVLDEAFLRRLLQLDQARCSETIDNMLDPRDRMNVKYAVDLLVVVLLECDKARARLSALGADSLTALPDLVTAQRDAGLAILGDVLGPLLAILLPTDVRLSGGPRNLSEQLTSLSKCAHALALLFNDDSDFVPSVLVHSLLANIFSSFNLVALVSEHALVTNTVTACIIALAGSDCVESFISFLRRNHDTNFNLREFEARLCSGMNASEVLERHPEWRPASLHRDTSSGEHLRAEHVQQHFNDRAEIRPHLFANLPEFLPAAWNEGRRLAGASFSMAAPFWRNSDTASRAHIATFVGGPFSKGASLARRADGSVIGSQSSWKKCGDCTRPGSEHDTRIATEDFIFDDVGDSADTRLNLVADVDFQPSIEIPNDLDSDGAIVALSKDERISLQRFISSLFGYSRKHSASRLVRVRQTTRLLLGDASTRRGAVALDVEGGEFSDGAVVVVAERTPVVVLVKIKRAATYSFRLAIGAVSAAHVLVHSETTRSGGKARTTSVSVPTLTDEQRQQGGVSITVDLFALSSHPSAPTTNLIELGFKCVETLTVSGRLIAPLAGVTLATVPRPVAPVLPSPASGGAAAGSAGPIPPAPHVSPSPSFYVMQLSRTSVLDAGEVLFDSIAGGSDADAAAKRQLVADALSQVATLTKADLYTIALPVADSAVAAAERDIVHCRLCGTSCERHILFAHLGAEILQRELHPDGGVPETHEFCGFCGVTPPCAVTLKRSKATTGMYAFARSGVSCLSAPLAPSYAVMSRTTQNSPCCNVPVYCPACEVSGVTQAVFVYSMAVHYRNSHPAETIPASFQFDDRHLALVTAAAVKAQKAAVAAGKRSQSGSADNPQQQATGKRDRSDAAGVSLQAPPSLIKRGRGRPRRSGNSAAAPAAVDAAAGSALAAEDLEGSESAGAEGADGGSVQAADELLGGASGFGVSRCASGGASAAAAAQADIPSAAAAASSAAAAAPAPTSHHRRGGYSRPIFEFMEAAASFYTIGSSAHMSDVQKMHEHARECRDVSAELAKRSIVAALRSAATDFETASVSADRYSDELLEIDVSEALLTAVQLRQEADALERRTLDDIRAELIAMAGSQPRARRPPGRFK